MGHNNHVASLNGDGSPLKTQQQQLLELDFLDIEFAEPTSVLDLTPCISPPLHVDVWTEQKVQLLLEEQHAQTQQAWERQQHRLHWEHQEHLPLLRSNWEQQEQIQVEQVSLLTSMDEYVSMVWDMDDQQQQPVLGSWALTSESDLLLEDLSSSTLPHLAMDDDFVNMESWIYGSDGSSITDDRESSTTPEDLDESSHSSSFFNRSKNADGSSPLTGRHSARAVMQNSVISYKDYGAMELRCKSDDTASDNAKAFPCSVMLPLGQQKRMAKENTFEVYPFGSLDPAEAPMHQRRDRHELSSRKLQALMMGPELQPSNGSGPLKSHQRYLQTQAIGSYQQQAGQTTSCVANAAPAAAAKSTFVKARTKLSSSILTDPSQLDPTSSLRTWQRFVAADFPAIGDSTPSPSCAGPFHGGMITQLDIAQGGRMGAENRNVRARMADAALSGKDDNFIGILENAYRMSSSSQTQNFDGGSGLGSGGLQMVHLLLACAEAVACRDSRQATRLLQQLHHIASPYGDSMQRVTSCFVEGLKARLAITGSQPLSSLTPAQRAPNETEKHEGFQLMYRACPYLAFGHYAANCAILDAFEGEEALHIVDLGMTHALQWPDLMKRLASRSCGPPKLLRITAFGLASHLMMDEAGRQLADCAKLYSIPFEFRVVRESLENLQPAMLELRGGEALAVNSVLQLHCVVKESRGSLNAVLQSIHELLPKILTLVEQNANHNGPFFLGRFMEALHYYSAIFDSLDAILPRDSHQRVKMEQFYFAEEIKNIVSCEGPARIERHERIDQWRRRMSRAGFQPLSLRFLNEARSWLTQYACDGYSLAEEKGCLVLGWKGKPLVAASAWRC